MAELEQRLLMVIGDEPLQGRAIASLANREGWRTMSAIPNPPKRSRCWARARRRSSAR